MMPCAVILKEPRTFDVGLQRLQAAIFACKN
jgi:hypothetical protein